MFKKCVIFLFLATAYTVLLAHNFTPHQHDSEQTTHHHGHDHDDDDHDDGNEKNSFHYFQHIGESGIEYTYGQFIKYEVQKKVFETAFIKLASIVLSDFEKPPLIVPLARTEHLSTPQTLPYFFQLKAPPAFTA
jgi:Tat protein secretion system quality control protein TatD with DNase activity